MYVSVCEVLLGLTLQTVSYDNCQRKLVKANLCCTHDLVNYLVSLILKGLQFGLHTP